LKKNSIATAAKFAVVYKEKRVTREYFANLKTALRNLASKFIDGYEIPFSFSSTDFIDSLREVQKCLEQIFRPFVQEKTIQKMRTIFNFFCNEELLEEFFEKRKWKECELVGQTLRKMWDGGVFE